MVLASGLASTLKGRVMVGASGQKPYYLVRPKAGQGPIAAIEEALAAMESAVPAPPLEIKRKFTLFYNRRMDFFRRLVVE